jgi:Uma2 family endonuclease
MAAPSLQRYTPEEYLALERRATYKSEYLDGFITAMAGSSRRHSLIAGNVFAAIHAGIRGRPCEAHQGDLRVKVSAAGLYTYPDVVALCGEARFEDAELDTLLNPNVIVEVLSESTEAYDRGKKAGHYRQLESLTDHVLISQDEVRVEHYERRGEEWVLREIADPEGTLRLVSIGCELPLREIYERVEFPAETRDSVAGKRGLGR